MVKTPQLFVVFRDSAGPPHASATDVHPLAVIEVLDFHLVHFGVSRIVRLDPHGAWARWRPQDLARVRPLEGKDYRTLGAACHAIFQAIRPERRTLYLETFQCFVVPPPDRGLLGTVVEHTHERGERVETRFSPELATVPVQILPDDDGREQDGVWLPVGLLRPIVPASVADEKARVEVDEMREKGSFELRKHKRDRPLSPGKTRNPESKRGKRQPTRMVVGKACFVRLAYPGSQPGHTYVILSIDLAPPAHRRGAPGELHARLRSLVDGSELVCTIHDLVPLVRCFADQWRQYAASSAPLREGLLKAVRQQASRCKPPVYFVAAWKQVAPGLPLPDELREEGAPELERQSTAGSSAMPPIIEDKEIHDLKLEEAENKVTIADREAPPGNPHLVPYDRDFGAPTARARAAPASSSAAAEGESSAAAGLSAYEPGDAVWYGTSVDGGVAAVVTEVLGPTSYRVARLSDGEEHEAERELLWRRDPSHTDTRHSGEPR